MTAASTTTADSSMPMVSAERAGEPGRPGLTHGVVLAGYLAITLAILNQLWLRLPSERLRIGGTDQFLMEWFLWRGPYAVLNGQNPLHTDLWDPPNGANLMANTSMLGIGLPLAPITWLLGAQVTLLVALTVALSGSAAAWYWLLRRLVPGSTLGGAIGGGFCAFAPAMISHANGAHLNLVTTFVIPFIIANALRLAEPGRAIRNGIPLGMLVTYQMFIGAEILLLAALGMALFCAVYTMNRPRVAAAGLTPMLKGLAVAVLVALPLLAYPLWWQFFGPRSYTHLPEAGKTVNDILAITTLPSQSLLGDRSSTKPFVRFHNEENAFLGVPLLIFLGFGLWWLRRELLGRIAAVMIVLALALSTGSVIRLNGRDLITGPWALGSGLPILNSLVVSRLAFIAIPFIGLAMTLIIARNQQDARTNRSPQDARVRRFTTLAMIMALVSVAPTPLPVSRRPEIPQFFSTGLWERFIHKGDTVMSVPMTMPGGGLDTITWQIPTNGGFALVGGYFVAPHGSTGAGYHFPVHTDTQRLLNAVWQTGKVPTIGDEQREQAQEDLHKLEVDVIVLDTKRGKAQETAAAISLLLQSQPQPVADVLLWRIGGAFAPFSSR